MTVFYPRNCMLPYDVFALYLLSALMARRDVMRRAQDHHLHGRAAARDTAVFIADMVSLYIRDINDGKHDPLEQHDHR